MVNVALVSRAADDRKWPEESRCIGANDEKNGPSDDLSACVENTRLKLGFLHLSRGKAVDSADRNRSSAEDYCRSFPWISVAKSSSQRLFMQLFSNGVRGFPIISNS